MALISSRDDVSIANLVSQPPITVTVWFVVANDIVSDRDAMNYAQSCPQCAISKGAGRKQKSLLHPIPTECPFQIVGVDVMELSITTRGNKYVVVFQDLFIK